MKKFVSILLTLMLVMSLVFGVSAAQSEKLYTEGWELSQDAEKLYCGDQVFEWYPLPPGEILRPEELYLYDGRINNPVNGDNLYVLISPDNPNMVFLSESYYSDSPDRVYVTGEGKRILDAYTRGEFAAWKITDEAWNKSAGLGPSLMEKLAALETQATERITMDVVRLRDVPVYNVMGYDETWTLAHTMGAIYELDGWFYYVNYDALDNTCFTGDGSFSYRSGTVTLLKLEKEDMNTARRAINQNMHNWTPDYEYEQDEIDVEVGDKDARITFFVMSAIAGFVIPAVPLVLGLVFARSKKSVNPHRWYLLSALAALWMILAAAIVMIIIAPV